MQDAYESGVDIKKQFLGLKSRNRYREIIHLLNQRVHEEWLRANALQDQLDNLRCSRLWRAVSWLRDLKQRILPIPVNPKPKLMARAVPYEMPVETPKPRGRVSIVIPFKDCLDLLKGCLRGLSKTAYRDFNVTLVNNGSIEPRTLRFLNRHQSLHRFRVIDCPGEFNFSRLCNTGAFQTEGEWLLFLNNDTETFDPTWLEHLLLPAMDQRVGIVGGTLLYPNCTIQHAGIFPQDDGLWVHAYRGYPAHDGGENGELLHCRSVPAVTGACLLIRRELFCELGGFDERYPVSYNDIDLCARVREKGNLVIVSPKARLLHYEALSRGYTLDLPKQ